MLVWARLPRQADAAVAQGISQLHRASVDLEHNRFAMVARGHFQHSPHGIGYPATASHHASHIPLGYPQLDDGLAAGILCIDPHAIWFFDQGLRQETNQLFHI